ncbi:YcaO-like family protein [Streptomyces sp. NPDC046870]|uniref:YcaO-like family protein n=1 Tax=Streptomyces sp. NPDC046870 TaxID=3155135 RepID=UPI0034548B84
METRARTAEETWAAIRGLLPRAGVTRVADVTWLDHIGIPVFQAVRPNALTLSVSQGKGTTPAAARVSAAMEALEVWHAEHFPPTGVHARVSDVQRSLTYEIGGLRSAPRSCLSGDTVLEWAPARTLDEDPRETLLPAALFRLDALVAREWRPPLFTVSSNGLASGTTYDEAVTHALYEVVERDALAASARAGNRTRVAPDSVTGTPRLLLDRLATAGMNVLVEHCPSPVGTPCFAARLRSEDLPVEFIGSGAHRDPGRALTRALTEAAQSRLSAIAGTREDLTKAIYSGRPGSAGEPWDDAGNGVDFRCFRPVPPGAAGPEWLGLSRAVAAVYGSTPVVVDLRREEFDVPVVRVVCPGTSCPDDY